RQSRSACACAAAVYTAAGAHSGKPASPYLGSGSFPVQLTTTTDAIRPFFDPSAARACTALGVLAATCSLTINAQGAPVRAATYTLTSKPLTAFLGVQWTSIDSPRTRRLFAAAPDHTTIVLTRMKRA